MENKQLTLGSLFDGSGGFPLGGLLCGITPKWASEVEPFAIRVTTKRLPQVKRLGDVSKIHGGEIEPVDIITFGSPCQDMSIAGKRAGLDGSRSNLFYEAIRIVKEMRCKTNGKYPRYIVRENVPGAFSSNGGKLYLRLTQIYDLYTKYRKDYAVVGETLTYAQFKKQLQHSEYFIASNQQKWIGTENRKRRVIDYELLAKHCDVAGFEVTDIKPLA